MERGDIILKLCQKGDTVSWVSILNKEKVLILELHCQKHWLSSRISGKVRRKPYTFYSGRFWKWSTDHRDFNPSGILGEHIEADLAKAKCVWHYLFVLQIQVHFAFNSIMYLRCYWHKTTFTVLLFPHSKSNDCSKRRAWLSLWFEEPRSMLHMVRGSWTRSGDTGHQLFSYSEIPMVQTQFSLPMMVTMLKMWEW